MTTAGDVIDGALRHIKVLDAMNSAAAEDAALCLTILNDMLAGWEAQGVSVNAYEHELASTFFLPERHVRGAKALLAVEIAPSFGKEVSPSVAQVAQEGWEALCAEYVEPEEAEFDSALLQTPSNLRTSF